MAAPTAGLHFTPELLETLARAGIGRAELTLHVGYGTFKPIRGDEIATHALDPEPFELAEPAAEAIAAAQRERRRIVAVGTTTTRTLEAIALAHDGRVVPEAGEASLFIYPGFQFQVIGALLTNFHLPKSSLLLLACAFGGRSLVLDAYRHAVAQGYLFYSYGDAMLIV